MLASLSSKQWGWKKKPMKRVYTTVQRSVMDYSAAAWQPWLCKSLFQKLKTAQNSALRTMSGQCQSTLVEAIRLQTGVDSYPIICKWLEEDQPRYKALSNKAAWLEAEKINRLLPHADIERRSQPD